MILIRRQSGDAQAAPDDEGTENVSGGFDPVGDEDVGMAEDSCGNLDGGEGAIHQERKLGEPEAGFDVGHERRPRREPGRRRF